MSLASLLSLEFLLRAQSEAHPGRLSPGKLRQECTS